MTGFNFGSLNLSGVGVSSGRVGLTPGKHIVRVKSAEIVKNNKGTIQLKIDCVGREGSLFYWINLMVPHSKEATRIGQSELKSLLYYGGHPNPDQPGDISLINGLEVGVVVKTESYTPQGTNQQKTRTTVAKFCDPAEIDTQRAPRPPLAPSAASASSDGLGDDIPF